VFIWDVITSSMQVVRVGDLIMSGMHIVTVSFISSTDEIRTV
jgi:hypothetical protein